MIRELCQGLLRIIRLFFDQVNDSGPYFKDYFDQPSRAQIGTMVAILEVGAFCKPTHRRKMNAKLQFHPWR